MSSSGENKSSGGWISSTDRKHQDCAFYWSGDIRKKMDILNRSGGIGNFKECFQLIWGHQDWASKSSSDENKSSGGWKSSTDRKHQDCAFYWSGGIRKKMDLLNRSGDIGNQDCLQLIWGHQDWADISSSERTKSSGNGYFRLIWGIRGLAPSEDLRDPEAVLSTELNFRIRTNILNRSGDIGNRSVFNWPGDIRNNRQSSSDELNHQEISPTDLRHQWASSLGRSWEIRRRFLQLIWILG